MEVSNQKSVIVRPVLSEKSLNHYKDNKVCTFWVNPKSTKKDIMHSFRQVYGVEPKSIRTVVTRKLKPNVNRRSGNAKDTSRVNRVLSKKAYIGIGDNTLDIFENIK